MLEKINSVVEYVKLNSLFYKKHLAGYSQINHLDDISNFPFTTKEDIAKYNNDFLCVPENKVKDFLTTSGTMGDPVSFYLTSNDLKRLAINEKHSFEICGVGAQDKILLTTTIDKCFMAGLAYFLGVQELGAGIIRTGPGNIKYQWDMIQRFRPNIIIAVPSFLLKMVLFARENDIDLSNCSLKKAICIGEPIRNSNFELNSLAQQIMLHLELDFYSTYASTEMMTAFTECGQGQGAHLQEELLFVEVLDEDGYEVKDGEKGEIIITTLGVEAMPLFRYKTGDICHVFRDKCKCGRSSLRLGPVLGRKGQRLKVKGTTIFPRSVIDAIYDFGQIKDFVVEATLDEFNSDRLCLFVSDEFLKDSSIKKLQRFLKSKLLFTPEIQVVDINIIRNKISDNNRKVIRFKDRR